MKYLYLYENFNQIQFFIKTQKEIIDSGYKIDNNLKYLKVYLDRKKDFDDVLFALAVMNNTIVGYYAKKFPTNSDKNKYYPGYIESSVKGMGSRLISEMSKSHSFISFVRICNIKSVKSHFKSHPQILNISESEDDSSEYTDLILSKIGYSNGIEYYPFYKDGHINHEISKFITDNRVISLVHNDNIINIEDIGKETPGIGNIKFWLGF